MVHWVTRRLTQRTNYELMLQIVLSVLYGSLDQQASDTETNYELMHHIVLSVLYGSLGHQAPDTENKL